jgi:hypothetical protein
MRLGDLRRELAKYEGLTDEAKILASVQDDSGEFVDQDVYPELKAWVHEGETYLYIETRVQ